MVPNLSKGAGIRGTALYVLHDVRSEAEVAIGASLLPEHQTQHRVGMTATRNLSTDDPELAWRLMCATAKSQAALKQAAGVRAGGRPSKYQCGHIALSWEHQTQPDAAEMQRAAEGALTALGWDKLQALIVEHRDHDHAHCHIVVNLVDPETGRNAPNTKNEYEKLQRWAHEYDKARGLEVCPQRAERMERAADDPTPSPPAKRWLSRKAFEAVRDTERAEHRTQALGRYREAAATVREQYRPEWSALYQEQRAELKALGREQRALLRELDGAARVRTSRVEGAGEKGWAGPPLSVRDRMAEFVNAHRETIWRGIDETNRPGDQRTLLQPAFVRRAIVRGYDTEWEAMLERHETAKAELQTRHSEARQEAYRKAWQPSKETPAVPLAAMAPGAAQDAPSEGSGGKIGLATALAASAAGIAAYALYKGREAAPGRDPQRDFDAAAERIARQRGRSANTNLPPSSPKTESPPAAAASNPAPNDLDKIRRRVAERSAAARQRAIASARDPLRQIGRERD